MTLIEGVGDEVTLVFGVLLIVVVILFAWFSTHTDDISLFREMGVIVVELSQRRTLYRNNRTEDSEPPGNEAASPESDQDATNENSSPSPENSELTNDQPSLSTQPSGSSTSTELPCEERAMTSESLGTNSSWQPSPSLLQPVRDIGNTVSSEDGASHEVIVNEDGECSDNSVRPPPLNGEEIRQRRVQYFQEGHQETNAHVSSSEEASSVRNGQDVTVQTINSGQCAAGATSHTENMSPESNLSEEIDGRENQLQTQTSSSASTSASPPSSENPQEPEGTSDNLSESQIRVRLRYLNETQRYVLANPDDTIGDFRRTHFQSELADNKWVRFIFNGQDLRDDARTLQACNIRHDSTMHCLVTSQTRTQPQHDMAVDEEDDSMLGTLMYPLFTILLAIVWYFRFTYRQYFSAMSTVCLIGISFILVLSYISSFRMSDSQQMQTPQQTGQAATGNPNTRQRDSSPN